MCFTGRLLLCQLFKNATDDFDITAVIWAPAQYHPITQGLILSIRPIYESDIEHMPDT